ncbi:MAG: bifunctional 4-hydroxy-3-methylbut-2-enyl diphosphate reductase/30S ribosomal protein S1 [Acidaminococcus sp.]|jgi:4-hydroxy-3-methylbut-2-enyl diphosphate reductase|nr:bifunctional 4-hydroxy-3-methylbut-2-enyl diphosphate reductase/30S ribosomal protein S1 [Acidaminococcus sp.]MCI2099461.1 bifunctional 4-hydroxy-3-methylbut-2-enyl diphosphate reductase/30S ribosomal protein S1 [Acidaminococcus sp.]MCI2113821.1 bifunctional 4-hydroxy-3-methylbut-2-enyl diphosphate reductase/30S ribosomal protein S1 [Acidaminococcus sp.]MCI2115605.1 bifunctional 4-hydroxy-3-methylbut-2-enyl diphosphate reductase/30S ribosomal protein S1 [Acidaminococcus sp.]
MKMKIYVADPCGFCYGVKRAVDIAHLQAKGYNTSIATLGELVHNPRVVNSLKQQGVQCKTTLDEFSSGDTVIFRSHGVGPEVYEEAKRRGLNVIDATCPHVRKAQKTAAELAQEGRFVIIVGEKRHPEVQSIKAWAGKDSVVIENEDDLESLPERDKYGVVSQTTFEAEKFNLLLRMSQERRPGDYKVSRTICTATAERQAAARQLAGRTDAFFVFGGKNSANTRHLWDIASTVNSRSYLLQDASEITASMLAGATKIGITAGASTPQEIIEEAIVAMETMESLLNEHESMKLHIGMIVEGTVVDVTNDEVVVDFGYQSEGSVAFDQWVQGGTKDTVAPTVQKDDKVTLKVIASENQDGLVVLSKTRAEADKVWQELPKEFEDEKKVVTVKGLRAVKGGLTVSYNDVTGFIPASHLDLRHVDDVKEYEGKELQVSLLEINPEKKRLVFSRRNVLREERAAKNQAYREERARREEARKEALAKAFETFHEGDVVDGTIRSIVDFGMFVEIAPYVQGLVHISEISWDRSVKPADLYKVGDTVKVYIKGLDQEKGRISLSIKQLQEDPWQTAAKTLHVGDIVTGTVVRFLPFGAIVKLNDKNEGMIHISEIAPQRIEKPEDVLEAGQEVKVKVLRIDTENKKIALSITKAKEDAEKAEMKQYLGKKGTLSQGIGDKLAEVETK